jgi:hypothetical protein
MSAAQTPPPPPAMTAVTMVVSSTANDQLSAFHIVVQGMSLTSDSGKKVSVLSQARHSEFIHINGAMEPVVTASIPQDMYTAATVTVGSALFTCVALRPDGGLDISDFAYGQTPTADVTVTLISPIAISGDSMGLSLNLMVSQSASYNSCVGGGATTYAITPHFSLSAFAFSSQRVTSENGGVTGLDGQVTALDSDSRGFQISLPTAAALQVAATSVHITIDCATAWQGVPTYTDLHEGTFVDLDGAIQGDGSIAATRVAVEDPAAVNVMRGPLLLIAEAVPILQMYSGQQQGKDADFSGETNPGVIEVYADTNTVMLTGSAPAPGDTLRFYGLVFNDQGTLRMDCAQISPGVTALSQ